MLLVFYSLASISIGFNILTMAISSWCMIFGPGLAIRGPDGSMSRAVAGMYQERKWALRFFWLGIAFIILSGVALGWVKFDPYISVTMTAIFLGFLSFMVYYMTRVTRPRFRFPKEHSRKPKAFYVDGYDPETGKLAGASARTRGGGGGDASRGASNRGAGRRRPLAPRRRPRGGARGAREARGERGDERRYKQVEPKGKTGKTKRVRRTHTREKNAGRDDARRTSRTRDHI